MDAKDYLLKVNEICADYEVGNCNESCPLHKYSCGIPRKMEDLDTVIDMVEHYKEKTYPFGRCNSCGKEFNSELINEYNITNCPWCGVKIKAGGEQK
jgi:DNA-directed RNA polymerase subunit RPC12/RpoP